MIKNMITILILCFGPMALAQSLVPATSEDLNSFDQQILESKKTKKANFGSVVSEKAKDLKNSPQGTPALNPQGKGSGLDNGSSLGKDARTSAPANNDRGNSANAPGRSGNRKK